jgi:hypothetical protein
MNAPADQADLPPPPVVAKDRVIDSQVLSALGQQLTQRFQEYSRDRLVAETKWLQNLRQYLGVYDPEIESKLSENRSKAYPRITRVKCIACSPGS